ncbi:Uncharacterised protein [Klebsiella pneumoniae]|nr:Uncharacterised protein [Klebsiella pneumoniae]
MISTLLLSSTNTVKLCVCTILPHSFLLHRGKLRHSIT